jgi:hypothetical protein
MPKAALRRSGFTAALNKVSESGMIMAPPAPWMARAAMRKSMFGAIAARADAVVKMAMPSMKVRRRPKRSPKAAAVSRKTAKVNV